MNQNLHFTLQDELKKIEGFSAKVYPDAEGHSIGYGTLLTTTEYEYWKDREITPEQAIGYLNREVLKCEACIDKYVFVTLTQNQFDALILFIYNVGYGAFKDSTLLKQLNKNEICETACEFIRWHHSMHLNNMGLLKRRIREIEIFLGM